MTAEKDNHVYRRRYYQPEEDDEVIAISQLPSGHASEVDSASPGQVINLKTANQIYNPFLSENKHFSEIDL